MEAYFIAVADAFDAMVSDRPYRKGRPETEALAEIERGAGTQFHPLVARAFVAAKRGIDPKSVLSRDERAAILAGLTRRRSGVSEIPCTLRRAQPGILVGSLAAFVAALATEHNVLALASFVVLGAAAVGMSLDRLRGRALSRSIARTLAASDDRRHPLQALRDTFALAAHPTWAAVVEWDPRALRGTVIASAGGDYQPDIERKIASWLLRDADDGDVLRSEAEELGGGVWLGLRLPEAGRTDRREAFAVFAFARRPAPWFDHVLRSCLDDIAAHLASSVCMRSSAGDGERLQVIARSA